MTTDAEHVENLAGLPEVKSLMPEWSTGARSVMSRGGVGVVSCFGSSEPADCQSYKAENCTDVTVSVHKKHMQVVNSCKAQEEIYMDQESVPATMNESGLQIEAEELSQDTQTPSTVLFCLEWRFNVVQTAICCCWSTEESRDRCAKSEPMGDVGLSLEAGPQY